MSDRRDDINFFHLDFHSGPLCAAVTDLFRRWQWEVLVHPPYSPYMSTCDYDLFAKVKESLRGTRYNTRDERIRAIERSIRNINKDGRAGLYDAFKTFGKRL